MTQDAGLGLDELMIVNPGPRGLAGLFLGADGTLYQAQPLGAAAGANPYYLSADGMLYTQCGTHPPGTRGMSGVGSATPDVLPSKHFLGADGVLYEVVSPTTPTTRSA